ncbi:MAG: Arc family DNA-binding protein [Actinobacteria bacterium]|nr:Arc family DNA-binding protein [Actinomycetota bacterium]
MPTLYVRNVPAPLYDAIKRWAKDSGRSVNAEILSVLEREAGRRADRDDWFRDFLQLREELGLTREDADRMIASIRASRDAG